MVGLWKKTHKFAPLSGRSTTWRRRQEAELGPRGATPSKRNLCPGTCSSADTPGPVWRNSQGTRTWLLLWKTGAALFLMKSSSRGSAEPVGEDYPATNLEHRLAEWLERRAAAPDTPPVKPQSPRQPIYLNLKRKAGEASEASVQRWTEPACSRCCRRTVSPACCPARESPFSRSAEGR